MKIKVLQENLNQTLQNLQKAIPSKPQLPILSSILFEIKKTDCIISATDLYFGVKSIIQVDSDEDFSFCVTGKQFKEIISSLSAGVLEMTLDGNTLTVKSGKTKANLACQNSSDYPPFPQVDGQEFVLSTEDLEKIDKAVAFSVSTDMARPVLTSLLFSFNQEQLKVVATDGFRLATLDLKNENQSNEKKLLIPAKSLNEVIRVAQKINAKSIKFKVSEELKQVYFMLDNNVEIFVRLIDGEYPPYERIIPSVFTTEVNFDTEEVLETLKSAMIFAREASNIVKFNFDKEGVTIMASSPSIGNFSSTLTLSSFTGNEANIAFNIKYIFDYLSAIKSKKHWFGMSESLKPAMFKPEEEKDYQYVVMPFKVN